MEALREKREALRQRRILLHSGHYSLIHNFQALAGRQGLTHRRLRGVQVPEVHGPLRQRRPPGSATAPPSAIER